MKYEEQVARLREEWQKSLRENDVRKDQKDAWRKNNKERVKQYSARYYAKNKARYAENRTAYIRRNQANEDVCKQGWMLREWRMTHGYTQKQLGEIVGVKQSCICNWELSKAPVQMDKLEKAGVIIC